MSENNLNQNDDINDDINNDIDNVEIFGGDELIYAVQPGENGESQILAGGFKVGSYFLQQGKSPIVTLNNPDQNQDGGKVSSQFEYLVVPAGLFYVNVQDSRDTKENEHYTKEHTPINDDIYDKLFALIQDPKKNKHKKTRKHTSVDISIPTSKNKNKKTRKHM